MLSKIGSVACAAALLFAVSGCGGRGVDPGNEAAIANSSETSGDIFEQDMRTVGPMGTGDLGGGANMIDIDVPGDNAGAGESETPGTKDATGTVGGGKNGGGTTGG